MVSLNPVNHMESIKDQKAKEVQGMIDLTVDHIYESGDNDIRFKELGLRLYNQGFEAGKQERDRALIEKIKKRFREIFETPNQNNSTAPNEPYFSLIKVISELENLSK